MKTIDLVGYKVIFLLPRAKYDLDHKQKILIQKGNDVRVLEVGELLK